VSVYGIAESQCTEEALPHILQLADELFIALKLDYGRVCLSDDYQAKNMIKNFRHSDGSVEPRHVIGVQEWPECLPGIYWTNYFGGKYFEQGFGQAIEQCEFVRTTKFANNGMRVQLCERPDYFRHANAREMEIAAMEALGRDWFFERDRLKQCMPLTVALGHFRSPSVPG
jgi:hypothetical protein